MAAKIYALFPSERTKECDHPSGFAFRGKMPCTGPRVCHLCGTREEDAEAPCEACGDLTAGGGVCDECLEGMGDLLVTEPEDSGVFSADDIGDATWRRGK